MWRHWWRFPTRIGPVQGALQSRQRSSVTSGLFSGLLWQRHVYCVSSGLWVNALWVHLSRELSYKVNVKLNTWWKWKLRATKWELQRFFFFWKLMGVPLVCWSQQRSHVQCLEDLNDDTRSWEINDTLSIPTSHIPTCLTFPHLSYLRYCISIPTYLISSSVWGLEHECLFWWEQVITPQNRAHCQTTRVIIIMLMQLLVSSFCYI